jgi:hypothetical protein
MKVALQTDIDTFTYTVQVSISAVFSKFCITPANSITFQPTTYNTQSLPRSIEVANVGVFPFQFRLTNLGNDEPERPQSVNAKSKTKGKAEPISSSLCVGPYVATPAHGEIAPGSSAQIQVRNQDLLALWDPLTPWDPCRCIKFAAAQVHHTPSSSNHLSAGYLQCKRQRSTPV